MITPQEILGLFPASGINADVSQISPGDPLDRHGIDSMDRASLMYQIELKYAVVIASAEYRQLSSAADFAELVNRRRPS